MTLPTAPTRHTWDETRLWLSLCQNTGQEIQEITDTLKRWMPKIQTILTSGGTSPTAFTLHDADHSFRVAERMAEIIPDDVLPRLVSYEIALLLLSAYLHDIGMTPEQRKVTSHYEYLVTGVKDPLTLSEQEIESFQQWLDDEEHGVTPPLSKGAPTIEDLRSANELITYYCRHRHNDWSEEWILDLASRPRRCDRGRGSDRRNGKSVLTRGVESSRVISN